VFALPTSDKPARLRRQYFTPGFHSDVVWLEDQRDYAHVLTACAAQYLDGCRADDAYGVFLHELTYLKPYIDTNPGEGEFIRALIKAGRVGTGGAHSLPSETILSGEAIVRNLCHGRWYHERVLGDRPSVLMLWDVFGHVSQLPQIAAGARFNAIIWSKDIRGTRPLFHHLGLDGTRVLTRRTGYWVHETDTMQGDLDWLRGAAREAQSLGHEVDLRLDCVDFRPPRTWPIGRCSWLAGLDPALLVSGQAHRRYFEEILRAERARTIFIPTSGRDFEWHHQGTGVAHIDLKIANRLCENALVNAEKFAAVASQFGARFPWEAIDKAWRHVLFNQHHDAITGPCCDRSYFDIMNGYREALELAGEALDRSLTYLSAGVNTLRSGRRDLSSLVIFNPLNWTRTDLVETDIVLPRAVDSFALETASGDPVPFEVVGAAGPRGKVKSATVRLLATVPGLGYTTVHVVPSSDPLPMVEKLPAADAIELENEHYRLLVTAASGGGIESLYDKHLGRDLINRRSGPANEMISIEEDIADHPEPPWEVMTKVGGHRYHSRDCKTKLEVWRGPVTSRVRATSAFKDCRRVQETVVIRGLRRVEFVTDLVRYRGKEHLHVVAFPVAVAGAVPVFDDRFGCVVKRKSRGYMDFRTWQWRNYSDCGARQLYQWLDLSRSVALRFSDGQAINLGNTSLVLARDPDVEAATNRLQEALVGKGVPCTLLYDDCERKRRSALPHEDATMPLDTPNEDLPWGTSFRFLLDVGETNEYLRGLLAKLPAETTKALRGQRKSSGAAVALVMERDIKMDLWDQPTPHPWPSLPTVIITARTAADLRNAVATLAAQVEKSAAMDLPAEANMSGERLNPDAHGVALLNRGTPLASVENDDTMALVLMHSVKWSRTHLDFRPVAEHKTHRFEYALYPHDGDWRQGRVPWAAYEYNNRLLAVQADAGPGALPPQMSFATIDGDAIVTALKPAGYPLAAHERVPRVRPGRIIARMYEPTGFKAPVTLGWFAGMTAAERTNLLEEAESDLPVRDGVASASLSPFRIQTVALRVKAPRTSLGDDDLGRRIEPAQPVYFAHWEHNMHAEPLGAAPIGLSLRGDVQTDTRVPQGGYTVNELEVGLVNNLAERIAGTVRFVLPDGWRVEPEELAFKLAPRGSARLPVTLLFESGLRRGAVHAQVEHDGQVYEAVLEVGEPARLDWDLKATSTGAVCTVRADYPQPVSIDAVLVTPHELWGDLVEGAALAEVSARQERLVVPPGGRASWAIKLPPGVDAWATVKLAWHGRVDYKQVRLLG
jgi:alpha-mannosidase